MNQALPKDILDSILPPEVQPMLKSLADEDNNIILADLPLSIQNALGKEGIAVLPKVELLSDDEKAMTIPKNEVCRFSNNITPSEIDQINPGSDEVQVQHLSPAVFKDLLDSGIIDKYRKANGIE